MKISLPPDTPQGQRDAITANDKNITVEAGAGTGKTWVLSQRYLNLLLNDDDLLPQDILTLTYTEAAAGEMKARIDDLVQKSLELFPNDERRQNVIDGLSDSWISTIHSFAARLIRESGLSLDIDPRASVISLHQEQSFWEDVRSAAEFAELERLAHNYSDKEITKSAKELDKDSYFTAAVGKWGAGTLSSLARNAAELHASSGRSWHDMMSWADDDSNLLDQAGQSVVKLIMPELLRVWHLWREIHISNVKDSDMAGNTLKNFLDTARNNPPSNGKELVRFYDQITNNPAFIGKTTPLLAIRDTAVGDTLSGWRKKQPQILRDIAASFTSPVSAEEQGMRKALLKFCAVSWGIWDNMKSKRGLLSFSDMILHAGSTINQQGIRKTFKHILVDEFQDTDPLQFGMIESLKNYGEAAGLFAVGDPKQSIYKFRHADPRLFAQTISKSDKAITLDTSFRTRAALLSRINKMFAKLWPDGISRQEGMSAVKYQELDPANSEDGRESGTMPDFRVYLLRKDSNSDICRRVLAEHLAGKISSWVKSGLTIWDKKDKVIRQVKFSDFAVLSRGRGCFSILEEALERYGIPSVQDRSNDYFSRGEIGDIVCTLRAAANFSDNFSVMGWLLSPFSGVNEDDAITKCLALADKSHTPIELMREKLPDAYSRLEYLAIVGENEGASGIISHYDRNRNWLSCWGEKDRLRVLRNVRLALRIAREFESSGTSSLVSCAEYMTRSVRAESSYEEAAWHDDNENAVRLGAVHSAKGLEYPVTIIFSDRTQKKSDTNSLKPSRDLGLVFSKLPDEKIPDGFAPKLADWHKLLTEQGDIEEEERLFYVACTRAQDSLIFCGLIKPVDKKTGDTSPKGYSGTWSEFLLRSIRGMNDVVPEILSVDDEITAETPGHEEESRAMTQVQTVKNQRALRQISATSFALYEWCPYAWRRKYRQGRNLSWELPDRDIESDDDVHGGAALGSLAHWVLSRCLKGEELHTLLYEEESEKKVPGYLRDTWRKRRNKDAIRDWLMTFSASPLGEKLRNTPGVLYEHIFRVNLTKDTDMAGAVDAVFGNCIVDYKITAADDVPDGLYDSQMDFYALALSEQKNFDSVSVTIAFLKENTVQDRVITDFAPIRERIERAAIECASGKIESYSPCLSHCGKCPFRKGCVKDAGRKTERETQ